MNSLYTITGEISYASGKFSFPLMLSGTYPKTETEEQKQMRLLEEKRLLKEKFNKFKKISLNPK